MRIFKALFILALAALLAYLLVSGRLSEAAVQGDSETFRTLMERIEASFGVVTAGTVVMAGGAVLSFLTMIWPGRRRREH